MFIPHRLTHRPSPPQGRPGTPVDGQTLTRFALFQTSLRYRGYLRKEDSHEEHHRYPYEYLEYLPLYKPFSLCRGCPRYPEGSQGSHEGYLWSFWGSYRVYPAGTISTVLDHPY